MDKKKQKTTPRLDKEEHNERTEDRKRMRKTKGAEPEASPKSITSEVKQQQQPSLGELTDTKSDQSDGNLRMKIGVGAKRTKKPPKSLENFICRPTIRISQRLAHGDGHSPCGGEVSSSEIRVAKQSHLEIQKKDRNDCISPKASTRLSVPLSTSSRKADSTPVITASKKTSQQSSSNIENDSESTSLPVSCESFQPGGTLFSEHFSASPSLNERQERGRREKRPNISKTHFQTNDIRPFSSCTTSKVSLSHLNNSKNTTAAKSKLKHVKKPLKKKTPRSQEVTGSEVKRRGRGRPRKNPAPCFSPPLPATPLHHEATESPAKRKKGERDDYTVLNALESMAHHAKKKRRKERDETRSSEAQVDEVEDTGLSQEPSQSHINTSSPSQDPSVSVNSQSEKRSDVAAEKKYEWAGLFSDVYKSENPTSLSSPVHTDCLDYDPEEHEHGLLPAPIHVGEFVYV
ncbi:hypothetical protein cypCar_00009034, partial [Cyprinus carpio]